jgi:regulatory factor X
VAKSNAQANAARQNKEQESQDREGRSDEDEDDESEPGSAAGSKRSSLILSGDAVTAFTVHDEMSDKTPTAANLLSQAQSSQRPAAYHEASIRRHPQHGGGLDLQAHSPASASASASYMSPAQNLKVSQLPSFPSIEDAIGASGGNTPHNVAAREIWGSFQIHLDSLLDCMRSYRTDQFEIKIRNFWSGLNPTLREIVHAPAIAGIMARADAILYDVSCNLFAFGRLRSNLFLCRKFSSSSVRRCSLLFPHRL